MQERHSNRERYFQEQGIVTEKYVIPYINERLNITPTLLVMEIGCGEAGNLKPFLDMGCKVIGIDIAANKIENGRQYYAQHPLKNNLTLIAEDIYKMPDDKIIPCDLIIMRDTIEHIPDQNLFLSYVKKFLKPGGKIFFGFPPWRMPFGGHQQICVNKLLSTLPYFHLLPKSIYVSILKLFGESKATIETLMEVRDTRISIQRFKKIVRSNNLKFDREDFYLINPNYEIKFKLKQRKLPFFLNIPYLRDFFSTTFYSIVSQK
ncbi:MAG TPA: class I SAM-dependent methyltransferase [Bacteroidia bacterium]|nr:class I SAM-dependent methyltransferase [Bacteroidia bacterium]